ncbi:hypothetical protein PTTG_27272 [Puccinia triticina 1-1 BBBD Race 1]|uniref:Uncharacterized protein n=1 Tax=Puccinia triticina (isolate 1-1 / race 1 (BBBD)) TaxID=630390 RepID=A0A180GM57_PUCT1|nr:hypothetical protein PTTG_27272 [Puccinia triticina 1-1 BBBD Race 1]
MDPSRQIAPEELTLLVHQSPTHLAIGIDFRDPTKKDIQRWSNIFKFVNALTLLAQGDFGRAKSYFIMVGKDAGESTGGELWIQGI